jgi:oligopeptide transport system substrate-binding protein
MPRPERINRALALMEAAGYGPTNRLHTTYLTTSNPDNKRTATALQEMMKQIYIDIDIIQVDPQLFYRQLALNQFDLTASAWIGDFNDASTFLDLLRTGSQQNYGQYSSAQFDSLYAQAQQQTDIVKRGELMKEAEQIALDDDAVIPVRFRLTQVLVQPYVRGWNTGQPNLRNFHRTRWLWIDPKAVRQ